MTNTLFTATEHIIPAQHIREYPSAVRSDQEATLYLHVKQYVPRESSPSSLPGITIVSSRGNGFPKECHEALWDGLQTRAASHGFSINSIWIADPVHQGLSYAVNEDKLSDDPNWLDHSRDLLLMVNHFRAEMKRPLVGVGHSMGGCQLVHLSIMHPRLFTALILLDPVIVPYTQRENAGDNDKSSIARLSTYRRDLWPSREEAATAIRKAPMFACWADKAWAAFVRHGLRDTPTAVHPNLPENAKLGNPPVTLTTPVQQEVHTFTRPNFKGRLPDGTQVINRKTHADMRWETGQPYPFPFYRPEPTIVHRELPALRPQVLFIIGGESFTTEKAMLDGYATTGTGVGGSGGMAAGKVKQIILDKVGHGVPFEAPEVTADHGARFIQEVLEEWKVDEEVWSKRQRDRPQKDHLVPSEEWKKYIGKPPARKKPAGKGPKL